jgi:hypothetical protein
MNDSLNRWLTNRGYTGSLNDKIIQYLRVAVLTSTPTDTVNDLWIKGGIQEGFGTELRTIQKNWAIAQGATSTLTWNDAMGTLPP